MIVSYYHEHELESAKRVSDLELNELLQEVRKKDNRYYLIEKEYVFKKWWFSKPLKKKLYTLLYNTNTIECQIINFCQDHDYSINTSVSKSYIHALFCGFLNGYKKASE